MISRFDIYIWFLNIFRCKLLNICNFSYCLFIEMCGEQVVFESSFIVWEFIYCRNFDDDIGCGICGEGKDCRVRKFRCIFFIINIFKCVFIKERWDGFY